MGWSPDMDIEKTFRLFERSTRESVSIWGKVTPIRVQNIEVKYCMPATLFKMHVLHCYLLPQIRSLVFLSVLKES
jgi:hypothetical protein